MYEGRIRLDHHLWSSLQVCKAWEASARRVRQGTRLVLLRTGIVLDGQEGGSLGMSLESHSSLQIRTFLVHVKYIWFLFTYPPTCITPPPK